MTSWSEHLEDAESELFEWTVSRISIRALVLFRIGDALWWAGHQLDRALYLAHDKPPAVLKGFGDLAYDLGGRIGARVERRAQAQAKTPEPESSPVSTRSPFGF